MCLTDSREGHVTRHNRRGVRRQFRTPSGGFVWLTPDEIHGEVVQRLQRVDAVSRHAPPAVKRFPEPRLRLTTVADSRDDFIAAGLRSWRD